MRPVARDLDLAVAASRPAPRALPRAPSTASTTSTAPLRVPVLATVTASSSRPCLRQAKPPVSSPRPKFSSSCVHHAEIGLRAMVLTVAGKLRPHRAFAEDVSPSRPAAASHSQPSRRLAADLRPSSARQGRALQKPVDVVVNKPLLFISISYMPCILLMYAL